MGLDVNIAREVLRCAAGDGLGDVATIGRLQQFLLPQQCRELDRSHAFSDRGWMEVTYGDFADDFFRAAGARSLTAVDASDYEGAGIVHDMNQPVGSELRERFDAVVDGGTMEHVFRCQEALANSMRMLRRGGHLIVSVPANNLAGHGFYQFSPEFFYRALSDSTGFGVVRMTVVECVYPATALASPRRAYEVVDPEVIGERVEIRSRHPLLLIVHAVKRVHLDDPFTALPQQSDYAAQWAQGTAWSETTGRLIRRAMRTRVGLLARNHALGLSIRRRSSLRNRRHFRRV